MEFSSQLVQRLRQYFSEKYDKELSTEETNQFLGSLARVYDALSKPEESSPSVVLNIAVEPFPASAPD